MSVKKCDHPSSQIENGKLVCVVCGASRAAPKIEDKEQKPKEDKSKSSKKK